MSRNLPSVESTSEFKNDKIKFTFYTESTLRKLLCKPNDRVATGNKKQYRL